VLEDADKVIGVVPAVMGLSWYDCTVEGMEAHAGPTPMHLRRDALQVATRIMQETVAIANRYPPYGRGTVGMVQVFPNSRNVIPGRVKFSIDLRNVNDELLNTMHEEMTAFVERTSQRNRLAITLERVSYYPPCPFHPDCVGAVRKAAAKLGYSTMDVVSGAGHDAIYVARLAPAGMIFVPCKDGISHNEIEDAQPAHLEAGCNVLLHAMLERLGTSTIDCCLWRSALSGSVLPMRMKISQRSCIAPVMYHLRPLMTYSLPSRRMLQRMLVASLDATSGSVMANDERISPASSGVSQRSCCALVP
jgi:N-carbamoyl-L-amino-acid hydrolase